MMLDSGIAVVCGLENVANPPFMPSMKLVEKTRGYFGFRTVGVQRFYQAAGADRTIDALVRMVYDPEIKRGLYAVLYTDMDNPANGEQYRIARAEMVEDEDDLRMIDLTLERDGNRYDVAV